MVVTKGTGDEFWCPNDPDRYLAIIYVDDYMRFPRSGVLHHGNDSERLFDRANNNGLDLSIVEQELDEIYTKIMSE
ncbi:hypothetical protein [Butyrivibrio hungatei]|uniref:hypothetical protein n=1 Tax=Butyrivibrio hungatei TaxID=185008 RepID=UPI0008DBF209|nr:hypothetical protein [Butyrivibrio hungatei]